MGLPADETQPSKHRDPGAPDIDHDEDAQWELLKHGLPGYAEFAKAKSDERKAAWIELERVQALAEIDELLRQQELAEHMRAVDGAFQVNAEEISACQDRPRPTVPSDDLLDDCLPNGPQTLAPLEFELEEPDELMAAVEETEIEAALDSGAVAHCTHPKDVPSTVKVVRPPNLKNFTGAGGDGIRNHGIASVVLEDEDGNLLGSNLNVAEVTRPLHAVGVVCDTDKEVLFTKGEAVVVPEGALSRFLASINVLTKYRRKGGLYVQKFKVRSPQAGTARRPNNPSVARAADFGRQGEGR